MAPHTAGKSKIVSCASMEESEGEWLTRGHGQLRSITGAGDSDQVNVC